MARREFADAVQRVPVGDASEHVTQPGLGVDEVEPGCSLPLQRKRERAEVGNPSLFKPAPVFAGEGG